MWIFVLLKLWSLSTLLLSLSFCINFGIACLWWWALSSFCWCCCCSDVILVVVIFFTVRQFSLKLLRRWVLFLLGLSVALWALGLAVSFVLIPVAAVDVVCILGLFATQAAVHSLQTSLDFLLSVKYCWQFELFIFFKTNQISIPCSCVSGQYYFQSVLMTITHSCFEYPFRWIISDTNEALVPPVSHASSLTDKEVTSFKYPVTTHNGRPSDEHPLSACLSSTCNNIILQMPVYTSVCALAFTVFQKEDSDSCQPGGQAQA